MRLILLFLAGATVFLLQRLLYRTFWNRGLDVRIRFSDGWVYAGESTFLEEEAVNDKRMPLPALEIRFAMDRNLAYRDGKENVAVSDKTYRRDVFSLFSRQKVIRRFEIFCSRRGRYGIAEAELTGCDFFFQKTYHDSRRQEALLYVYPRPADIRKLQPVFLALSGMRPVRNPVYQDPFAFAGIRGYDRSDPMNRINWKASAKSGEWMVNQFDATTDFSVCCLLDTEDAYIRKAPYLVEEGISIAAALAARLFAERTDVEILGNGYLADPEDSDAPGEGDPDGPETLGKGDLNGPQPPGDGKRRLSVFLPGGGGSLQEMYRALACLEVGHAACSGEELLKTEADRIRSDCLYVLVSKNYDRRTASGAAALARAGGRLLWVCPVEAGETDREEIPLHPGVHRIRWEVET